MSPNNLIILQDGRMDTKSAAAYLGLAERTLENKRSNGTGPKFVKRGRVFYFRDDLDEWLRAGRVGSTAEARARSQRKSGGLCADQKPAGD